MPEPEKEQQMEGNTLGNLPVLLGGWSQETTDERWTQVTGWR